MLHSLWSFPPPGGGLGDRGLKASTYPWSYMHLTRRATAQPRPTYTYGKLFVWVRWAFWKVQGLEARSEEQRRRQTHTPYKEKNIINNIVNIPTLYIPQQRGVLCIQSEIWQDATFLTSSIISYFFRYKGIHVHFRGNYL